MDQTLLAQILWAETGGLAAADVEGRQMLRALRAHIAALAIETQGAPFPGRQTPPAAGTGLPRPDGAAECEELAHATAAPTPAASAAILIWSGSIAGGVAVPTLVDAPVPWSGIDVHDLTVLGPFDCEGTAVFAHLAQPEDGTFGTRFVSHATGTGLSGSMKPLRAPVVVRRTVPTRARYWGYGLVAAAVVAFVVSAGLAIGAGAMLRAAVTAFRQSPPPGCLQSLSDPTERTAKWIPTAMDLYVDGKPEKGARPLAERTDCAGAWSRALAGVATGRTDPGSLSPAWRPLVASVAASPGQVSVRLAMAGMMGSLVLVVVAAGLGVLGRPLGILIDPRYRMSLTRAQLALWTVVILGGWTTLALFNVGFSALDVRQVTQEAYAEQERLGDSGVPGPLAERADRLLVFPQMDWPLWAVLGISLSSLSLSKLIVGQRLTPSQAAPSEARDVTLTNASPKEAELADFVYGETAESRNVVDVTRVQHVGITAVLGAGYFALLAQSARAIGAFDALRAADLASPVFASMPPINEAFLALLTISHGALLAGKLYDQRSKTS